MAGQNDGAERAATRDARRAEISRLEAQPIAVARAVIRSILASGQFARDFASGNVRGTPLAVMNAATRACLPKDIRDALQSDIIVDWVRAGKLKKRHPEVSVETMRQLQNALDHGEMLLQRAMSKKKPDRLLVLSQQDGQWMMWGIRLRTRPNQNAELISAYPRSDLKRLRRREQSDVEVLRAWKEK